MAETSSDPAGSPTAVTSGFAARLAERVQSWTGERNEFGKGDVVDCARLYPGADSAGANSLMPAEPQEGQYCGSHGLHGLGDLAQGASGVGTHATQVGHAVPAPARRAPHEASAASVPTGDFNVAEERAERAAQSRRIRCLERSQALARGINSAMLRLDDRNALLCEACRVAVTDGGFALSRVSLVDSASGQLTVLATCLSQLGSSAVDDTRVTPGTGAEPDAGSRWVAREERSLVVNDLPGDARWLNLAGPLPGADYRSAAAFPLYAEGQLVAVLMLLSADADVFDGNECEQLERVAADLSFALAYISRSQRLRFMEYHDALTGLANGALFADRVNQLIVAADPGQHCIAVVMLDIEHFSELNATLGHGACDELLRNLGQRLCAALPARCSVARITADTFAIAGASDGDDAASALLERLLDVLQEPVSADGRKIPISVQLGVALFPADGADADSLFKNADSALREARDTASRYAYYSPELTRRVAEKRQLEVQLRAAIEQQQFALHYQPRVDLRSGCMVGAEALIRWHHPTEGLTSPQRFIPLAEETGLIVDLGAWAIDEVCRQQAAWLAAGLPVVPVAVNLSSVQFAKSDLLDTIRLALGAHHLAPGLLELELTESAMMLNPSAARETLGALRELGCSLALDDFGTGYSSLAHLKHFPFDSVKIDRGFVTHITSNREDAAIATAIIAMAHQMELMVIAEGVEDAAQLCYLRDQGCDQIQGYLFSAAVPAETFAGFLRQQKRLDFDCPEEALDTSPEPECAIGDHAVARDPDDSAALADKSRKRG
jgi:diguanylate cyclase (GGDEF)-like protein